MSGGMDTYIDQVINNISPLLSDEERVKASAFIRNNEPAFSKSEMDIGRTKLVKHSIDTGDARPFKQQLRRHPQAYLEFIDQHVDKMMEKGIVSPTSSPWSSNVVLVRKKGGELRFCVDYRKLNSLTVKDSYPLPRIDTCLDALGGQQYFSTLDMRSGYWQIEMDDDAIAKSAFVTRKGVFQFNVLSFGLSNAPAMFQRLMDLVLSGLTWDICLAFLDDVIIMSRTFQEHIERLQIVFDRIRNAGLKLNPSKCKLFQESVKFLGSIITRKGILPDPEKVEKIVTWPVPTDLTQVRAFVALASYYRRHIRGFQDIAYPLTSLTKTGERFVWTEQRQAAFEKLKHALATAPIVCSPHDGGGYILDTDASDHALGAVLQQRQDDQIVVIAYASKGLDNAQRSYCTTRKELLAIIYGLQQYRHYLLGYPFEMRTDHSALTTIFKSVTVGQQARWLDLLAEYDFVPVHRAGLQHRNADSMSRRPCERDIRKGSCKQCRRQPVDLYCPVDEQEVDADRGMWAERMMEVVNKARELRAQELEARQKGLSSESAINDAIVPLPARTIVISRLIGKILGPAVPRSQETDTVASEMSTEGLWGGASWDEVNDGVTSNEGGTYVLQGPQLNRLHAPQSGRSGDTNGKLPSTLAEVAAAQRADNVLSVIIDWLQSDPTNFDYECAQDKSREIQNLWSQAQSLLIKNEVLYRHYTDIHGGIVHRQIVIPVSFRTELMRHVHGGTGFGHPGVNRTSRMLQRYAYWYGWKGDITRYVRRCDVCIRYRNGPTCRQGPLQPQPSSYPFEKFHIDLTGPHVKSKHGFQYLLTGICNFTKYLITVPLRDKTALSVANALVEHVYLIHGCCEILVSDCGTEFVNDLQDCLNKAMGIQKIKTTAYRPSSNGVCERVHRTLHAIFAKTVSKNQRDWCEVAKYVTWAYNIAYHTASTESPYFLLFGRQPRTPLDIQLDTPQLKYDDIGDYTVLLLDRMRDAYELVSEELQCVFGRAKRRYDTRVKAVQFQPGQYVMYTNPATKPQLTRKWILHTEGPYIILKKLNNVNYWIQRNVKTKPFTAHIDRLTPYLGDIEAGWCADMQSILERYQTLGTSVPLPLTPVLPPSTDIASVMQPEERIDIPRPQGGLVLSTDPPTATTATLHTPVQPRVSVPETPRLPTTVRPQRDRRPPLRFLQCSTSVPLTPPSVSLPWWRCEEGNAIDTDLITSVPENRQPSASVHRNITSVPEKVHQPSASVQRNITSVMEKTVLSHESLVPSLKPSGLPPSKPRNWGACATGRKQQRSAPVDFRNGDFSRVNFVNVINSKNAKFTNGKRSVSTDDISSLYALIDSITDEPYNDNITSENEDEWDSVQACINRHCADFVPYYCSRLSVTFSPSIKETERVTKENSSLGIVHDVTAFNSTKYINCGASEVMAQPGEMDPSNVCARADVSVVTSARSNNMSNSLCIVSKGGVNCKFFRRKRHQESQKRNRDGKTFTCNICTETARLPYTNISRKAIRLHAARDHGMDFDSVRLCFPYESLYRYLEVQRSLYGGGRSGSPMRRWSVIRNTRAAQHLPPPDYWAGTAVYVEVEIANGGWETLRRNNNDSFEPFHHGRMSAEEREERRPLPCHPSSLLPYSKSQSSDVSDTNDLSTIVSARSIVSVTSTSVPVPVAFFRNSGCTVELAPASEDVQPSSTAPLTGWKPTPWRPTVSTGTIVSTSSNIFCEQFSMRTMTCESPRSRRFCGFARMSYAELVGLSTIPSVTFTGTDPVMSTRRALTSADFDRRYDLSQYRIDEATRDSVLRDFEYIRTAVPQPVLEDEGDEFFSDIQISSADVSAQSKKRSRDDGNSFDAAHVSKSTAVEISTVTATNVISSCNVFTSSSPPLLLGGEDSQDQFASIVASASNTDINDIQPSLNLFDAESSTVAGYLVEPVSPAETVLLDEREAEQSANDSEGSQSSPGILSLLMTPLTILPSDTVLSVSDAHASTVTEQQADDSTIAIPALLSSESASVYIPGVSVCERPYSSLPFDLSHAQVVAAIINHPGKTEDQYFDSIMNEFAARGQIICSDSSKDALSTAIHVALLANASFANVVRRRIINHGQLKAFDILTQEVQFAEKSMTVVRENDPQRKQVLQHKDRVLVESLEDYAVEADGRADYIGPEVLISPSSPMFSVESDNELPIRRVCDCSSDNSDD